MTPTDVMDTGSAADHRRPDPGDLVRGQRLADRLHPAGQREPQAPEDRHDEVDEHGDGLDRVRHEPVAERHGQGGERERAEPDSTRDGQPLPGGQVDVTIEAAQDQHDHHRRNGGHHGRDHLGQHVSVGRQGGEPQLPDPAVLALLRDALRVAGQRPAERADRGHRDHVVRGVADAVCGRVPGLRGDHEIQHHRECDREDAVPLVPAQPPDLGAGQRQRAVHRTASPAGWYAAPAGAGIWVLSWAVMARKACSRPRPDTSMSRGR